MAVKESFSKLCKISHRGQNPTHPRAKCNKAGNGPLCGQWGAFVPCGGRQSPPFDHIKAVCRLCFTHGPSASAFALGVNDVPARIAILGAGGMGKTTLARAALHHQDLTAKYTHTFFVVCDSATTSVELAAVVGFSLGLKAGKDLTKGTPVVQKLSRGPPCLLVLDNLETSWENSESRAGVEEFLSLLTDVSHLGLILTDNMPLAVNLLAHLVDYEGCSSVLQRWKTERTSLLSAGYGKGSNFDASISISVSSPRMTDSAKELLSLLSILLDGLSDIELLQSNLSINNILTSKTVLLQTSLAHMDQSRLRVLLPVREHVKHLYPPRESLVQPLQQHFHVLLDLYCKHIGVQTKRVIDQITANLGNLQQILMFGLNQNNRALTSTIYCTISLNTFRRLSENGLGPNS
ncbi:hypothetical protein DFH09DRAFT_1274936 [Mycena vulgaris]|nr:hypothetical protein DFH09DRAFT_1274936 [Mycena vulgaris]